MKYIVEFFTNFVLMSAVIGWITAQILKGLTGVFKLKKFTVTEFLFGTGGMPSSHTAAVVAVAVSCGMKCGLNSPEFGISCVLAMIVMRDAMGMRRQVGEHAKALNKIFKELAEANNDPKLTHKALGELAGHTPLQVFAGVFVGVAVPCVLMFVPAFGML